MKRTHLIYLLLSACAIFPALCQAQIRYGFRFGGTFASAGLSHADDASMKNRSGFSGGLVLEYQMPDCGFASDIALLYTRYSTRLSEPGEGLESIGRNFIEIPLHFKYKFWMKSFSELVGPMIYTGPSLLISTGHNATAPLTTRKVLPGWDLGIGFDIVNFIQITGGYRFGLGNAVKDYPGYPDARLRTNGWNISATLLFDF